MKKAVSFLFRWIIIPFFVSTIFFVVLYRFIDPPVTPLMIIRLAEQLTAGESMRLNKEAVPIGKISPAMQTAVIASEDNLFLEHQGFDFKAIEKAKDYNERTKGKKIRGASTISQQTAKNVFLWPQRSWVRKGLEVYFTFLIEQIWTKKRILEVYLNVIETGNGVYGVEAASDIYFHKHAKDLTPSESALIAAILPNPRKWNPVHPSPYLSGRQQWIIWNMNNIRSIHFD